MLALLTRMVSLKNTMAIALVLAGASALFYGFSLYAVAMAGSTKVTLILESNPMMAVDLIAACGKAFTAMVISELMRKPKIPDVVAVSLGALAVSQFLVQSWAIALLLLVGSYLAVRDAGEPIAIGRGLRGSLAALIILLLHVGIALVLMRIALILQ